MRCDATHAARQTSQRNQLGRSMHTGFTVLAHTLDLGVRRIHIMPADDWREHEALCSCWCSPSDDTDCPDVMLHHAMDGREAFEDGRRLAS